MNLFSLIRPRPGPCVSLYLPTHRALAEAQQDRIRFKNLLRTLPDYDFLEPARALIRDELFWRPKSDGLAVFAAPDFFHVLRENASFVESVHEGPQFHVTPLLPLMAGRFWILALSRHRSRLFLGTREGATEIELPVHPHGPLLDRQPTPKPHIEEYFRQIDRALDRSESLPLLLAGVDFLHPLYRNHSTYPRLLDEGLEGNFDRETAPSIHRRAWPLIERHLETRKESMIRRFHERFGSPRVSNRLREIRQAARRGRVEILFAPPSIEDAVLIETLLHDGTVFPARELGAILREA